MRATGGRGGRAVTLIDSVSRGPAGVDDVTDPAGAGPH